MFQKGDIVQFNFLQPALSLVTNIPDRSFASVLACPRHN